MLNEYDDSWYYFYPPVNQREWGHPSSSCPGKDDYPAAGNRQRRGLALGTNITGISSHAGEIAGKITISPKIEIVVNHDFKEGMSSSVKCGIKNAPAGADAFMLLLGDQPFISPAIINRLLDEYQTSKHGIVIPVYNGKHGHPVIFAAKYKQELLAIADQGAKAVVNNHLQDILEVPLDAPEILTDIDTPQDYQKAKAQAEGDS